MADFPRTALRVTAAVRMNVNIGAVELRMVATPASSSRVPQATMVQGMTLFMHAWNMKRRQFSASVGILMPRQCMMAISNSPAISVRPAISVTGGIVVTATFRNV